MTQVQLAKALHMKSTATVSQWETGARFPKVSLLPKLAEVLGCSVDELLGIKPHEAATKN